MKESYLTELRSLPYPEAYSRLKSSMPGWTRTEVLWLLPRVSYIPEMVPPGSVGEKIHAALAELVLARALVLLGFKVMVPRRKADMPDVLAFSPILEQPIVFDAKCVRFRRQTMLVKDAKVYTLDDWRSSAAWLAPCNFTRDVQFVSSLRPSHTHPGAEVSEQLSGLPAEDYDLDDRDAVEWSSAAELGTYLPRRPGESAFVRQLGAVNHQRMSASGAVIVVPYMLLRNVKSRINEECCDMDVTILAWEHVYALLKLGARDSLELDGVWHMTRTLRKHRDESKWRESLFAQEDVLLSRVLRQRNGSACRVGHVRDLVAEALAVELRLARRGRQELVAAAERVDSMSVEQLRREVRRLWRVEVRLKTLDDMLDDCAEWCERRAGETTM